MGFCENALLKNELPSSADETALREGGMVRGVAKNGGEGINNVDRDFKELVIHLARPLMSEKQRREVGLSAVYA